MVSATSKKHHEHNLYHNIDILLRVLDAEDGSFFSADTREHIVDYPYIGRL